ncbi:MAG: FAD-dependent oxidoreductase [Peptococcaceae bacterium]|jgi:quinone-modifying oxidoreductase subunit QmoB|nr:FAD-dependent oxidoreductase [Peptococcaceae bacterium]
MAKKIGVFICTGCSIGEALDTEALARVATKEKKIPLCKKNAFLCGRQGAELIKQDVVAEGLEAVVIAACSPRINYDVFDFGPSTIVERVNLREQVVWSHPADDEDTQAMAEDYLRMGITKAQASELPVPYLAENMVKSILVVGGGLAGLTAANEAALAGYRVVLVEKEPFLGGFAGRMYKSAPSRPPYTDLEDTPVAGLVADVEASPLIEVHTKTTVARIEGGPCLYDVTLEKDGQPSSFRAGAIVVATGARPYDAARLDRLGYGRYANVVTGVALEDMAREGKIQRPADGKPVQNAVFVLCAGSRDPGHLPYCSSSCCVESLKQALYLKEQNPDAGVYVIFKDIRTLGRYEEFYKKVQNEGVIFIKGEVTAVSEDGSRNLSVEFADLLLGERAEAAEVDLVVLATGMVPSTVDYAEQGAEDCPAGNVPTVQQPVLNLAYRQGPELPALNYGFPDSHFICFPYETRRTGIYAAGSVRAPMDLAAATEDATGAAMKAIQCVELTSRGAAVHPRVGDLSYPEFFMQRCTQCKRCTEECPFGAINEDEKANPLPNPTRCRRCGVCMGACPERIISFKNYSVPMIGNMIKAIDVPEEDEEKPRIVVFACENDAYPALDMAGLNHLGYNAWVRVIPVRCLGSMNLVWVADSLSKGIDGILLLGCKHGDDYQCHFIKGSELADIRLSKVAETLGRLQLEPDRVRMVQVNIMDYDKVPGILDDFAERLVEIGPNPYKGF